MYVGTEDGFILEFSLSEEQNERGKTVVRTTKVNTKALPTRSPITFVRCCSALNRLLVLCDGVLSVLRQDNLSNLNRIIPSSMSPPWRTLLKNKITALEVLALYHYIIHSNSKNRTGTCTASHEVGHSRITIAGIATIGCEVGAKYLFQVVPQKSVHISEKVFN